MQIQSLVALERLAVDDTRSAVVKVCCGDEHAARVQRRAAQVLVELGWSAKADYANFNSELRSEYILGKKGQLVKKRVADDDA